jgi:hypothetical protein
MLPFAAVLALAIAFAIGRASAPRQASELASVGSFRTSLDDPDWLTRTWRMSAFLQSLAPENVEAAVAELEPVLPWITTDELRLFMLAWVRFDPIGALDWALALDPPFNRNAGGAALYAWAFRNPAAAVQALDSVSWQSAEIREFMQGRLVAGWAHGPHRARLDDYLSALEPGSRRFSYIGMLAWELSKQGAEAVRRWAEGIPDEPAAYKSAVFLKAGTTLAAIDPEGTARWLASRADREYTDGAFRVVVRGWARSDPSAALAWVVSLPEGDLRDRNLRSAFRVWHDAAPDAAERWLRAAAPSRAHDAALRVMVERRRKAAPAVAREWAALASDEALRSDLLARVESDEPVVDEEEDASDDQGGTEAEADTSG